MQRTLATLEVGLAGAFGEYFPVTTTREGFTSTSKCSVSGIYGRERILESLRQVVDGGLIVDKRLTLRSNYWLAVSCPLLDVSIDANAWQGFRPSEGSLVLDAFKHGNALQRGLAAVATSAPDSTPDNPGPCDSVGLARYAQWWADKGAKIGKKNGGRVDWANGESWALEQVAEDWSAR